MNTNTKYIKNKRIYFVKFKFSHKAALKALKDSMRP